MSAPRISILLGGIIFLTGSIAISPMPVLAFTCDSVTAPIGGNSGASDDGSTSNTACGRNAKAGVTGGIGASAYGAESTASANLSSAYGISSTASEASSSAFGASSTASGENSSAFGANAQATDTNAAAFGTGFVDDGLGNNVAGATAGFSSAFGFGSTANVGGASAFGASSVASNSSASAFGTGSTATGVQSTAIGNGANASNDFATAVGVNSTAAHANSSAFGNGATTTRADQQVFGTTTNTYTMSGIATGASKAAQGAPTHLVTSNLTGDLAAYSFAELGIATGGDVANLQSQINRLGRRDKELTEGIASIAALAQPILLPGQHFAVRAGWGGYDDANAVGFSAAGVIANNLLSSGRGTLTLDGGVGFGTSEGEIAGRGGASFGW